MRIGFAVFPTLRAFAPSVIHSYIYFRHQHPTRCSQHAFLETRPFQTVISIRSSRSHPIPLYSHYHHHHHHHQRKINNNNNEDNNCTCLLAVRESTVYLQWNIYMYTRQWLSLDRTCRGLMTEGLGFRTGPWLNTKNTGKNERGSSNLWWVPCHRRRRLYT